MTLSRTLRLKELNSIFGGEREQAMLMELASYRCRIVKHIVILTHSESPHRNYTRCSMYLYFWFSFLMIDLIPFCCILSRKELIGLKSVRGNCRNGKIKQFHDYPTHCCLTFTANRSGYVGSIYFQRHVCSHMNQRWAFSLSSPATVMIICAGILLIIACRFSAEQTYVIILHLLHYKIFMPFMHSVSILSSMFVFFETRNYHVFLPSETRL